MKSVYLLCEYGIPISTIEVLVKNNIMLDEIITNAKKLDAIFGKTSVKKKQIVKATKKIVDANKINSIYELVQYGLSKTIADKLFKLDIRIENINENYLVNHHIGNVTCSKIIKAYNAWENESNYEILINECIVTNIIYKHFGHNSFSLEELKKVLREDGYSTENLSEILENIEVVEKEQLLYLDYNIRDLAEYGLSNTYIKYLEECGIKLDDINESSAKECGISKYKFGQIMLAYNKFKDATGFTPKLNENTLYCILVENFKHENYSIDDIYYCLNDVDTENIDKSFEKLIKHEKVLNIDDNEYRTVFPNLKNLIKKIDNKNGHYDIVVKKLSGMTLEQIGQIYGVTRERIRQIFTKEISKIKDIEEEKYLDFFKKYAFDEETFCKLFNEEKLIFYYLKEKYQVGDIELSELIDDERLTDEQSEYLRKKFNLNFYNGENIIASRTSILVAILKVKDRQVEYREIMQTFNNIIDENSLDLEKIHEENFHNIDAVLNRNDLVLNTFGKAYRYYDCKNIEEEDLKELKTLFDIEAGVYSSELFFKDNPILMKKIDIRDEYELHNLFRKVLGNFDKKIIYARMPDIYIDCDDKVNFIDEKINELSPISLDDFVEYIYQNYGHKVNTMKAFVISNFNQYINIKNDISYLITACPVFDKNQYTIMKEYLVEDVYSNITIKQLLTDKFNVNDFKLLNNMNFNQLGYKVRGNYIMKNNISSLENYFRDRILKLDYYVVEDEMRKIGSTFTSYLYKFIYEKILFKIDENKYITITKLNKMGIQVEDIEDFINKINKIIPENEYFNLYTLNADFESKLFDKNFSDCFYETIIMIVDNVKMFKVKNNTMFIKTNESATREKFINSFINKNKIYISEIKNDIKIKYKIDLQESYIKEFINRKKFYLQGNTNCVYLSKEEYENEINRWDILKYID